MECGKTKHQLKAEKPKTRRGYGNKNRRQNSKGKGICQFSIMGSNSSGLKSKKESFFSIINIFKPSVITIQETKMNNIGNIKVPGYQVFEKVRKNKKGGGLLTAADNNLNPILISSKDDENEILTIQVDIGQNKLRIINGYGPQEDDENQRILGFWQEIEAEIVDAKDNGCLVLVQMDANAKAGYTVIKNDPNPMSGNGKIMLDIIERQNLVIANAEDLCQGVITRERVAENRIEKSVIDYILMCEEMKRFLISVHIDEDRNNVLHRIIKNRNGSKVVNSDHNILHCKFSVTFTRKPIRINNEFFNFKCEEGIKKFVTETSTNTDLSECFYHGDFKHGSSKFFKTLKSKLHKCFKKIRIRQGIAHTAGNKTIQDKLKKRRELKVFLKNNKCTEDVQETTKLEIEEIEAELAVEVADKNAKFVNEVLENVEDEEGRLNHTGFWKIKKKLVPMSMDPPMAKKDKKGNLVTAPAALKNLYLETYQERLRQRKMKEELEDVLCLKTELWQSRLSMMKNVRTKPWSLKNLEDVLKNLKNNKTRDPNGMIHEIFKSGYIGTDLKLALLHLFNGIKAHQYVPMFITLSNITTIFKKGSRFDLNNDRGIFITTVLKKILDKLIYGDFFSDLDWNMSDSNIGARRRRNIKDHLFIIHGIINSVVRGDEECIDIQIYDLEKAFDGLWLIDTLNDIFETLPAGQRNDELALLYETNRDTQMAIKTAVGMTKRVGVPDIVQQGGTWGSLLCANSIDTIGKKCRDRNTHCYYYKNKARILPLGFIDDLNGIAKCGQESLELNTFINAQIELKRLRFHVPDVNGKTKCHKIHIGKSLKKCPALKVHGTPMPEVSEETYLGDILSNDGKNTKNVENRMSKGIGIINNIFNLLENIVFGNHYFEIALLLRESMLINGIMTNAEIWYNLTKSEIEKFESIDRLFFRRLLSVAETTPKEAYYLEMGCIPINILLKGRRVKYLHSILKRNKTGMLYNVFITQWNNPCKGDWTEQVKTDLEDLNIPCSFSFIKSKSKESFKTIVKAKTQELSLTYLKTLQLKHSKLSQLHYHDLKMQHYFTNPELTVSQKQMLFRCRVRMENFGENFRGGKNEVQCRLCNSHLDNLEMAFQCLEIRKKVKVVGNPRDILEDRINNETTHTITQILKIRGTLYEK